jgi:hypothetical protein
MKRYPVITLFLFLFLTLHNNDTSGQQQDNSVIPDGKLSLRINSMNFIKNNEYANTIDVSPFVLISTIPGFVDKSEWIEGYTLPGFFFQPELVYNPSGRIAIRAGTHILKYSGTDKFSRIRALFSTSFNLSEHSSIVLGSLSGADSHRLFDPHFDRERIYSSYTEDGLQFTYSNDFLFNDTWISWENFISRGDSAREAFLFGESFRFKSPSFAGIFSLEIPVQVQFKHLGGQISDYPEPVETYFNAAAGLRVNINPAENRYGEAAVEFLQFFDHKFTGTTVSELPDGNASWIRFHYTYKALYLGAAYWKSHNFFAPNGNVIYASILKNQSAIMHPCRELITNYIYLTLLPEKELELFLGLETYYDVTLRRMDNSITIHLHFDKLFELATLSNQH